MIRTCPTNYSATPLEEIQKIDEVMVKSVQILPQFKLHSIHAHLSFTIKCLNLDYIFVGWPRIHLTGPSVVPEPNPFCLFVFLISVEPHCEKVIFAFERNYIASAVRKSLLDMVIAGSL